MPKVSALSGRHTSRNNARTLVPVWPCARVASHNLLKKLRGKPRGRFGTQSVAMASVDAIQAVADPAADGEAPAEAFASGGVGGADDADKGGADSLRGDSTELSTAAVLPEQLSQPAVDAEAASAGPSSAELESAAALIQGAAASAAGPNTEGEVEERWEEHVGAAKAQVAAVDVQRMYRGHRARSGSMGAEEEAVDGGEVSEAGSMEAAAAEAEAAVRELEDAAGIERGEEAAGEEQEAEARAQAAAAEARAVTVGKEKAEEEEESEETVTAMNTEAEAEAEAESAPAEAESAPAESAPAEAESAPAATAELASAVMMTADGADRENRSASRLQAQQRGQAARQRARQMRGSAADGSGRAEAGVPAKATPVPARSSAGPPRMPRSRATGGGGGGGRGGGSLPLLDWSRRQLGDNLAASELDEALRTAGARSVWLHDNALGSEGGATVGQALRAASPAVVRLTLGCNALGDEGLRALLEGLGPSGGGEGEGLAQLRSLGLGLNKLGDGSVERLLRCDGLAQLQALQLGGNPIGPSAAHAIADAIGGGIGGDVAASTSLPSLTSLQLGYTALGDEAGAALAASLVRGGGAPLRRLQLHNSGLGPTAARAFADALGATTSLRELALGGNALGGAGAAGVLAACVGNTVLEKLWLDEVGADASAAPQLAAAMLSARSALQEVWLGGNQLEDPAAEIVAAALPAAAALQRLWLDRNRFGPRGCRALAEAASQHGCALHELRLGGNARLSTADVASLAKLGEPNPERTSGQLRLKLQMAG